VRPQDFVHFIHSNRNLWISGRVFIRAGQKSCKKKVFYYRSQYPLSIKAVELRCLHTGNEPWLQQVMCDGSARMAKTSSRNQSQSLRTSLCLFIFIFQSVFSWRTITHFSTNPHVISFSRGSSENKTRMDSKVFKNREENCLSSQSLETIAQEFNT